MRNNLIQKYFMRTGIELIHKYKFITVDVFDEGLLNAKNIVSNSVTYTLINYKIDKNIISFISNNIPVEFSISRILNTPNGNRIEALVKDNVIIEYIYI